MNTDNSGRSRMMNKYTESETLAYVRAVVMAVCNVIITQTAEQWRTSEQY